MAVVYGIPYQTNKQTKKKTTNKQTKKPQTIYYNEVKQRQTHKQ
jgi:hypothetical protein